MEEALAPALAAGINGNVSKKVNAAAAAALAAATAADADANTNREQQHAPGAAAAAALPPDDPSPVAVDPRGLPLDQGGCFVCKRNDQQDLILLCDGCDGEYHTFCVQPPLRRIPDDEWFCKECKAAGKGGAKPDPVSR